MHDNPVRFDIRLLREDMVARGWLATDLARAAEVSDMTVTRFLRGQHQTARTAKKLADAFGFPVRRYMRSSRSRRAVA